MTDQPGVAKLTKGAGLFEQNRIADAQRKFKVRKSEVIFLPPAQEMSGVRQILLRLYWMRLINHNRTTVLNPCPPDILDHGQQGRANNTEDSLIKDKNSE